MALFELNAPSNDNTGAIEDAVIPFMVKNSDVKGRIAKIGPTINHILTRHDYPESVSHLLGELLIIASLLGTMMKREGLITIQASGDGGVDLLVADCTHDGKLRGYANMKKDATDFPENAPLSALMGKGYLAITMDYTGQEQRYQGIVELAETSLHDSLITYFKTSEQIDTSLSLGLQKRPASKRKRKKEWQGGGIIIQRIPDEGGVHENKMESLRQDQWERAEVFLKSVKVDELTDPELSSNQLLYRLFHEEGVLIYDPTKLHHFCRCSRPRIESILSTMSEDDIKEMQVGGEIKVTCQFCNKTEVFTQDDVVNLRK